MKTNKKSINTWDKVAINFGKIGPKYWNVFGSRLVELSSINIGGHVFDKFKKDIFVGLEKFNRDNGLYFNMVVIYAFGQKH